MKRLVVTADDFGLSLEVNAAVEQAHRAGILSAASLMVAGAAVDDAVAIARRNPRLRVGLHLALVEAAPALPAGDLPHLADARTGRFFDSMVRTALLLACSPAARRELIAEVNAQCARFVGTGLALDHINAHKHFHLHPVIAGEVIRQALRHGVRAIRAPVEPREILKGIEPSPRFDAAEAFAPRLRRKIRAAGLVAPDHVFGLAWSGALHTARLRGIIERLPEGLSEIYTHPATQNAFGGAVPGYRYRDEFDALCDPGVMAALAASGAVLGGFADFV